MNTASKGEIVFKRELQKYLDHKKRKFAHRTYTAYRSGLLRILEFLKQTKEDVNPINFNIEDAERLYDYIPVNNGSTKNKQYYFTMLNGFLQYCGNTTITKMDITWPQSARPNVYWLNQDEMSTVKQHAQFDPEMRILFHLMGELLFRRIEVIRSEPGHFMTQGIIVMGKGHGGVPKPRTICPHPNTATQIQLYQAHRNQLIRKAMEKNYMVHIPKGLILRLPYNRPLLSPERNSLDKTIKQLSQMAGVKFSAHVLRRSGARIMWLKLREIGEPDPVSIVQKVLGHEDRKTTMKYIGVNVLDQEIGMRALATAY